MTPGEISCEPALIPLGLCLSRMAPSLSVQLCVFIGDPTQLLFQTSISAHTLKTKFHLCHQRCLGEEGLLQCWEVEGHEKRAKLTLFTINTLIGHLPNEERDRRVTERFPEH